MHNHKKIGDILIDLGVLTAPDVENILWALRRRDDRTKFGRVAREMGLVNEEHILAAVAVQMRMFPGIQDFSMERLLCQLRKPLPVDMPVVARARRQQTKPRSDMVSGG
jgi:hypothetical protein